MQFENQNVVITGASSGIGSSLAKEFHARGANLFLIARREDKLTEITDVFNSKRQNSARFYLCDLTAESIKDKHIDLKTLIAELSKLEIDILVNNAGRGSYGLFSDADLKKQLQMIELNLIVPVRLTHALIPQMKKRKSGSIINISSVAGFQPVPFMSVYSGTKAFNYYFSMSLRYELKRLGINVLTVCPGPTESEFGDTEEMGTHKRSAVWDTSEKVAFEIVEALIKKKSWIITAKWSRLLALPCRLLPKSFSSWILSLGQNRT